MVGRLTRDGKPLRCARGAGVGLAWAAGLALVACGPRLSRTSSGADSARDYVIAHRVDLERDISMGSGRAIYDLAGVAGCQDSAELGRALHKRHDEIFASPRPSDEGVAAAVVQVMSRHPAARCIDLLSDAERPFGPGRYEVLDQRRGAGPVMREVGIRRFDPPDR